MSKSAEILQGRYPIRTVSSLTGVNSITLRAWERRYNLIHPLRTQKGHRLYSEQDIDLIYKVVSLLEKGIPISQAKQTLQTHPAAAVVSEIPPKIIFPTQPPWEHYLSHMLVAISRFDEYELDATYNEALSIYPIDMVDKNLLFPVTQALGKRWETGEGTVGEEHFFIMYLRNKLGARFHHRAHLKNAPRLLGACFPCELHELGLLLFALTAHHHGFETILLGANMPLEELPLIVKRSKSLAIVLSGKAKTPMTKQWMRHLAHLTCEVQVPVFVGGSCSIQSHDDIVRAGATPIGEDVQQALRCVATKLNKEELLLR